MHHFLKVAIALVLTGVALKMVGMIDFQKPWYSTSDASTQTNFEDFGFGHDGTLDSDHENLDSDETGRSVVPE